ncbi:MAG: hypothetical protein ACQETK_07035 [Pseudomonadota bacterium]
MSMLRMVVLALAATTLLACGSSSDDDSADNGDAPPPGTTVSANGLWEGTFSEEGVGTFDVTGLLYDGRIIAISEGAGAVFDGSYSLNGDQISASVVAYEANGPAYATTEFSGTVTEQVSLSASFATSEGTSGTISLAFDDTYNRPSSLGMLEGVWSYFEPGYDLTVASGADGSFFGQDSEGCVVTGEFGIIDAAHNLYDVQVTATSCGFLTGSYTGFAGLLEYPGGGEYLQVAVSNPDYLLLYPFDRQ